MKDSVSGQMHPEGNGYPFKRGPERGLRDGHFWYAADVIIIHDEAGRISDCNEKAVESLGYSRNELLQLSVYDIAALTEDLKESPRWRDIPPGGTLTAESVCLRKDGSAFPVEVCVRHRATDRPIFVAIVRDITEKKKAEDSLKRYMTELEDMNATLRILLKERENLERQLSETMTENIKRLVYPHIESLMKSVKSPEQSAHLMIIRDSLERIMSPFSESLSYKMSSLSNKEIQVANMVREGRQDKDMSELLGMSIATVRAHRRNIRRKLGIKGQKVNLKSFLSI